MSFNSWFSDFAMTWSKWFNGTSMTSVRSGALTLVVTFTVIFFSVISSIMLLDNTSASAALNKDPGIRAAAQTTETSHHSYGMQIVTAIFTLLGSVVLINAGSQAVDRSTSREHTEAKAKGAIAGVAAAAAAAQVVENAKNGVSTKEHAALVINAEKATTEIKTEGA